MSEIVFGPYFVHATAPRPLDGFESLNVNMEFSSGTHALVAPIYREADHNQDGRFNFGPGHFYVPAQSVSWRIVYRPYYSKQVDGVLLISLEDLLQSLCAVVKKGLSLRSLLGELRGFISPRTAGPGTKSFPKDHLQIHARNAGLNLKEMFSYGRSLSVGFAWFPPQDLEFASSPLAVSLGVAEFLAQPDGTLNGGKWRPFRGDCIGNRLRKELGPLLRAAPKTLFTPEGWEVTQKQFKWQPVHFLKPRELKEARLKFIREHQNLWSDPKELARALQKAQLYQKETDIYQIRKGVEKLLDEAQKAQF